MAATIKGLTLAIDGDTKSLQDALSGVSSDLKGIESELKQVDKLLKLDPDNTELLAQQQKLLGQAVGDTADKLEILKTASTQAYEQLEKGEISEAQFRALEREIAKTEASLKSLETRADEPFAALEKSAQDATDELQKLEAQSNAAMTELKTSAINAGNAVADKLLTSVAAVTAAISALVISTTELSNDIAKLETNATDAGFAIDDVSGYMSDLSIVSQETDSNVEALSNLLEIGFNSTQMEEAIEGISGAVVSFPDTLKVESLADSLQETIATGASVSQFGELLERTGVDIDVFNAELGAAETQTERTEIALRYLAETGMAEVKNAFVDANKELVEYNQSQYDLEIGLMRLADEFRPIATDVVDLMSELVGYIAENKDEFILFTGAVAGGAVALKGMYIVTELQAKIKVLDTALKTATATQTAFNVALSATGVGAAVVAIGTLIGALAALQLTTESAIDEVNDLTKSYESSIKAIDDNVTASLASAKQVEVLTDRYVSLKGEIDNLAYGSEELDGKMAELESVMGQLNDLVPGMELNIDSQTGAVSRQTDEVIELAGAYITLAEAQAYATAYQSKMQEAATAIIEAEDAIKKLDAEGTSTKIIQGIETTTAEGSYQWKKAYAEAEQLKEDATNDLASYSDELSVWQEKIAKASEENAGEAAGNLEEIAEDAATAISSSTTSAVEEISDAEETAFEKSVAWIEARKEANELSLAEELIAWERVLNRYEEGTEERIAAEEQYLSVKEEIISQAIALENQYADALSARTSEILDYYGIFDEVEEAEKVSSKDLITNLEDQVEQIQRYAEVLDELNTRGISSELYDELSEMGIDALPELEALVSMTDEKLTEYQELFEEKNKLATAVAAAELTDLKTETDAAISELVADTGIALSESESAGVAFVQGIEAGIESELPSLYATAQTMVDDLNSEIATASDVSASTLSSSGTTSDVSTSAGYATQQVINYNGVDMNTINTLLTTLFAKLSENMMSTNLLMGQMIVDTLYDAIPKEIRIDMNTSEVAKMTWEDFVKLAESKGLNFAPSDACITALAWKVVKAASTE